MEAAMKIRKLFNGNYATISLVILFLFILTGCGTAAGADGSAEPGGLEAYLNVQNSVPAGSGEPIMVYWFLENHTQEALYLLKWYTPLEVVGSSTRMEEPVRRTTEQAAEIISTHLLAQKPGFMESPPLTFEEVPDERVWKELQGQVFRVTEGIFKNESFLLRHDSVIQLGEALSGQGLTSLVVCDLDQDGQSELIFTYAAGLGPGIGPGIQTRVGMLEPDSEPLHLIEADLAYLGYAGLRFEETTVVGLNVVDSNQTTKVLRYLDRLGYLSIEIREAGVSLILKVDPKLSPEVKQNILLRQ